MVRQKYSHSDYPLQHIKTVTSQEFEIWITGIYQVNTHPVPNVTSCNLEKNTLQLRWSDKSVFTFYAGFTLILAAD